MLRTISLAAMAIAVAAPAMAQPSGDAHTRSIRVQRSGLDLSNADDAATLLSRLQVAARHVCEENGVRGLAERNQQGACMRDAVDTAVASLDAPMVTALYESRDGQNRQDHAIQVSSLR